MKVRIVYKSDKSIAVIHPAPMRKNFKGSEQEWLEYVLNKAMDQSLKGLSYDDVDISELPQSREDRNAWTGEKGEGISIDQVKATKLRTNKQAKMKIDKKIRRKAIDDLINEGELSADYEESENE